MEFTKLFNYKKEKSEKDKIKEADEIIARKKLKHELDRINFEKEMNDILGDEDIRC